jgi:hypothetical protein
MFRLTVVVLLTLAISNAAFGCPVEGDVPCGEFKQLCCPAP